MEEGISGFGVSGTWEEIVEHGERITEALLDAGVSRETLAEWQSWRPKATEGSDEEMNAAARRPRSSPTPSASTPT